LPANNSSFIDEAVRAVQGVFAAAVGRRDTPLFFDFSQRGLVGSFIALLIATGFDALTPSAGQGSLITSLFTVALLYSVQMGASYLVLRQFQRLDGFVPYIVVDNWVTLVFGLLFALLGLFGLDGQTAIIVSGLVVIMLQINIARLVVTLQPLQIAVFLVAQMISALIALTILMAFIPPVLPA
jgi:hypothetical protein